MQNAGETLNKMTSAPNNLWGGKEEAMADGKGEMERKRGLAPYMG